MKVVNSDLNDLGKIFDLYRMATAYMKSKKQVAWPDFEEDLITHEIEEQRQYKVIIDNQIACIWAVAFHDALIWGKNSSEPSVYIHRIATNPDFRGRSLVKHIVEWADNYCTDNSLKFIRLDTVGLNKGLIEHYKKLGFDFLGTKTLDNVKDLPAHYSEGPVCLFQREPLARVNIDSTYTNK